MKRLCQLEFYSHDVDASLEFARLILGWKRVPVALQDQAVIEVPEHSSYGISIRKSPSAQSGRTDLIAYFEAEESLADVRERCLALGGTILQEPTLMTGYGTVMVVEDRGGLRYGLYEARFEGPRPRIKNQP